MSSIAAPHLTRRRRDCIASTGPSTPTSCATCSTWRSIRRSTCRPTIRRPGSTTSPARSASRRRSSRPTCPRRRRSAGWRSAGPSRRRWSSTARQRTRRRTITSRGCRSGRAAGCWSSTCSRRMASTPLTVTPIFGDNMSPAGFGSVPCEQIEILLDGERLALMDWKGGGRAPAANCGGRVAGRGGSRTGRPRSVLRRSRRAADARAFHGPPRARTRSAPRSRQRNWRRFSTSTSTSCGRRFRRGRRRAIRSSRTSARCASRGRSTPTGAGFAEPPQDLRRAARAAPADETAVRADASLRTSPRRAFRRPAAPADVDAADGLLSPSAGRRRTSTQGVEMVAGARAGLAAVHLSHRRGAGGGVRTGQAYRISDLDLASRLSFFLWSTQPDDELLKRRRAGPAQGSGRARAAGAADAEGPARGGAGGELRRTVAEPARPAERGAAAAALSRLRRSAAAGDARAKSSCCSTASFARIAASLDLLTRDYTFVNERLAKHYGIPNVYGSQFRRVTLGPEHGCSRGAARQGRVSRRRRRSPSGPRR